LNIVKERHEMPSETLERIDPAAYERIVVFFANALGDHVMALPAVRALSAAFGGRFTLATGKSPTDLLFGDVRCERVVQIPIPWGSGLFDAAGAAELIGPVDLFVSANTWDNERVSRLLDCLAPTLSVGLQRPFQRVFTPDTRKHYIDQVFRICDAFGVSDGPEAWSHPFPLPDVSLRFAAGLYASFNRKMLVIHVETKPDKRWAISGVNRSVEMFLDAHPEYVAVALAKHPASLDGLSPHIIPLAALPVASAAAVIRYADLFLGADSFPLHVADLCRIPGAGVFGPTSAKTWGYRFSTHARHIQSAGRMEDIDVHDVASALDELAAMSLVRVPADRMGTGAAPVVTLRYC
jgi:ADP-heptose:LPS heptosyltransferase